MTVQERPNYYIAADFRWKYQAAKGVLVAFDDAQLMELLKAYSPAAAFPQNGSPTDSGVDQ